MTPQVRYYQSGKMPSDQLVRHALRGISWHCAWQVRGVAPGNAVLHSVRAERCAPQSRVEHCAPTECRALRSNGSFSLRSGVLRSKACASTRHSKSVQNPALRRRGYACSSLVEQVYQLSIALRRHSLQSISRTQITYCMQFAPLCSDPYILSYPLDTYLIRGKGR